MGLDIFSKDFKARPFWWEAYSPQPIAPRDLPGEAAVVIVGAGYAGLSAALELSESGIECLVLDAAEPGFGGSTRNGGMVSSGANVGKRYLSPAMADDEALPFLADAGDAFSLIETLIEREKIDCGWHRSGYFVGAWSKAHYESMAHKVELLNKAGESGARLVPRAEQRQEIGSDYYRGGMVVERSGHLHPALYYKGLLAACERRGIAIQSNTEVTKLTESGQHWLVETPRGTIKAGDVLIATNGYTGGVTPQFQRRVVPVGSYIIATEEIDPGLARQLSPKNRAIADSRRVLTYYRLSPDGRRMIFGGRAKFGMTDPVATAPILYRFMTDRFPELKGTKITHAWTGNVAFTIDELPHMGKFDNLHFALGCNGSGIAMMTYLGQQTARKIARRANRQCAFDQPSFPDHKLYNGNTWFLPWIGRYFRTLDWLDRRKDG